MLNIFSACILCVISICALGNIEKQSLYDAASAYQRGDFPQAIAIYENIYQEGNKNGSLLFNLGNAYYKDGQLGKAIGSYFKALEFIPRNADLKANLKYVLAKTKDKQDVLDNYASLQTWTLSQFMSLKELLYFAGVLWLGGCIGFALSFWSKVWRKGLQLTGGVLGICGVMGMLMVVLRYQSTPNIGAVVVDEAEVFASPSEKNSIVVFKLHEGALVKFVKKELNWVAVEFSDQKRGWLPAAQVAFF